MSAVPGHDGSLIYVYDSVDNRKWLVDGGALLSIVPPTAAQRAKGPDGTVLRAANGTKISCFGNVRKVVTLGDRTFDFDFIIADVQQSILGADFLSEFYLAPNRLPQTVCPRGKN